MCADASQLRLQFCERDVQLRGFERQFELIRRSGLPAFLHSRAAAPDTLAVLRRHAADLRAGGVVHSFDGTAEEAASLLELPGIYIGAGRWLVGMSHQARSRFLYCSRLCHGSRVRGLFERPVCSDGSADDGQA